MALTAGEQNAKQHCKQNRRHSSTGHCRGLPARCACTCLMCIRVCVSRCTHVCLGVRAQMRSQRSEKNTCSLCAVMLSEPCFEWKECDYDGTRARSVPLS